ncbi:MAG: Coenzyme F420 hydrogenase/dehydrogenase, beta subunit C-terminal domain [Prevotella sp.]|nr:Coenzyme F420 hydrogenase/dehydrogenase, beta subunit C-terminal domain [Prevotella sp.]
MITITRREECCGCSACEQTCPKHCITLLPDKEGFWYPQIDLQNCIDCHLCEKVCPVINQQEERTPLEVYAAYNRDEYIRTKSSSGGMFTLVAERIINSGGIVFGVKFDEKWNVVFSYTDTLEGLENFRGSKYVQAALGNTFHNVEEFLKQGKPVLFTGTPCQVSGLKCYLRRDYENLLTIDLICEGVPSPKVWKKYLTEEVSRICQDVYHIPEDEVAIKSISFRNKSGGWKQFAFALSLENKLNKKPLASYINRNSAYLQAMFRYLDLRPICYECPFKSCKSHSDVTIADYWGIQVLHPEMDDDKGTSMVYLNTQKGKDVFHIEETHFLKTNYEEAFGINNIITSVRKPPQRDDFYAKIDKSESIIKLLNHYTFPPTKEFLKNILGILLPKNHYQKLQRWIWRQRKK